MPAGVSAVRGGWIACPGVVGDGFGDNTAELVQVKQVGVFGTVSKCAGGHHDRVLYG